jgi:tetratricopeptide (TPR) repeat protein
VLAGCSVGFGSWSYVKTEQSKTYTAAYVGRESCAACHAEEAKKFVGSHHDLAMDPATDETVVDPAAFDDQEFTHFGVTSKFFRRDKKFFVATDGEDGTLQTYEIKYVFGVDPLQQYMIEFPDRKKVRSPTGEEVELPAGRVQVLSIAWDTHAGRWFHLYPKQNIAAGDWLHWTGGGQNWNYMCAECHSTNLQKNFDLATNSYHTTWSEIDVGCEACHGPAGEHVARANSSLGFSDPRHFHSYALNKLKGQKALAEIETCAPCHSRHRIVHPDYSPGKPLYDFLEPEKLDGTLYFADGQIKEELYEYGSFLQSRMFRENVRCSNCHDPHSLKPKFVGNALCTQCHVPGKYDVPTHHHHKVGSTGAKCVECHMPERTYMEVDPRRDHSIRVPRPDLTQKLGVPNACSQCHDEGGRGKAEGGSSDPVPPQSLEQLIAAVDLWFPNSPIRNRPHYGEILEPGRRGDPHAGAALRDLALPKPLDTSAQREVAVGPNVRASAVALLAGYYDAETRAALDRALNDVEPQVRAAAVHALGTSGAPVAEFRTELLGKLSDTSRDVRTNAANVLTQVPPHTMTAEQRQLFEQTFAEWESGYLATADSSGANLSLAEAYARRMAECLVPNDAAAANEFEAWKAKAEAAYRRALAIDPLNVRAMVPFAVFYDTIDRDSEAEQMLKRTLAVLPLLPEAQEGRTEFTADVQYRLGWLLFRNPNGDRIADAAMHFKASLDLVPNNPQAWQYYGIALLGLNRFSEGAAALEKFCTFTPQAPQLLATYARRAAGSGQTDQARVFLQVLLKVDPEARTRNADVANLIRELGGI